MVRALRREFGPRFSGGARPIAAGQETLAGGGVATRPPGGGTHIRWVQSAVVADLHPRAPPLDGVQAARVPGGLAVRGGRAGARTALPRPPRPRRAPARVPERGGVRGPVRRRPRVARAPAARLRHAAWEYWQAEGRPEVCGSQRCLARVTGPRRAVVPVAQATGASVTSPRVRLRRERRGATRPAERLQHVQDPHPHQVQRPDVGQSRRPPRRSPIGTRRQKNRWGSQVQWPAIIRSQTSISAAGAHRPPPRRGCPAWTGTSASSSRSALRSERAREPGDEQHLSDRLARAARRARPR